MPAITQSSEVCIHSSWAFCGPSQTVIGYRPQSFTGATVAKKKNVEELREAIGDRPIELLEYAGSVLKNSVFRCLEPDCGNVWQATTDNVIRGGKGCPKCARSRQKISLSEFELEISGRNIEVVEYNSKGQTAPSKFRCTAKGCGHEWVASAVATRKGQGCRECWKRERGLTEPQVRANLLERDIELVEYRENTKDINTFRCLKDGHVWKTNLGDVLRGQGCRKCAGLVPLTENEVTERLRGRTVELLHYAGNTAGKSKFRCLIDGHTWETTAASVMHHESGCAVCAGNLQYTRDRASDVAKALGYDLLEYGGGVNNRSLFRCHKDGYEWWSTLSNIRDSTGCPKCLNRGYMAESDIKTALQGRPIELSVYGGKVSSKSLFRCTVDGCGHEWMASTDVVLDGTGCPKCAGVLPIPKEEVEARIAHRPINLLSYGGTVMKPSVWECKGCGHVWEAPADRITNAGTGCPACAEYGFNPNLPAMFYSYKMTVAGREFFGFGVTCDIVQRDYYHNRSMAAVGASGELFFFCEGAGREIQAFEKKLKTTLPICDSGVEGFRAEATLWDSEIVNGVLFEASRSFTVLHIKSTSLIQS